MNSPTSRRQAREQAFILAFEKNFTDDSIDEILEAASLCGGEEIDSFAVDLVEEMLTHIEEIDQAVMQYAKGWKMSRISKVSLTLLRLTISQLLYRGEDKSANDPAGVAISEAVRLSKKYSTPEDASFVNGVLGSVARSLSPAEEEEKA